MTPSCVSKRLKFTLQLTKIYKYERIVPRPVFQMDLRRDSTLRQYYNNSWAFDNI